MKRNSKKNHIGLESNHELHTGMQPARLLVLSFLVLIILGTICLMLPISSKSGEVTPFVTALFTATSAVCVTGLSVVNTLEYWSDFGHFIILLCIQAGGLGFMTLISMGALIMRRRITLRNRLVMQEALSFSTVSGVVRFVRYVVFLTLAVEGIGACLLAVVFIPEFGMLRGLWYGIFHSISAFCNAGFALVEGDSLSYYVGNGIVNFTIMALIIIGGLGYVVLADTWHVLSYKIKAPSHFTWKQTFGKLSLHTKIVWIMTAMLLLGGFVFFLGAEYSNPETLGMLTFKEKIYAAAFHSVTTRTAGFNTIPLAEMTDGSILMTIILMFIGGSPAGTAGGVKTVTIGVLVLCAFSTVRGSEDTVVFGKRISSQTIRRALTIIMIAGTVVTCMLMILIFTENFSFLELLYEVISAIATVGISLGITPQLSVIGQLVIIMAMFIGRLGTITIAMALVAKQRQDKNLVEYPEESVIIG